MPWPSPAAWASFLPTRHGPPWAELGRDTGRASAVGGEAARQQHHGGEGATATPLGSSGASGGSSAGVLRWSVGRHGSLHRKVGCEVRRGAASPSTQGERMAAVELLWWGKNENDGGRSALIAKGTGWGNWEELEVAYPERWRAVTWRELWSSSEQCSLEQNV
jgi:hypothetical protein